MWWVDKSVYKKDEEMIDILLEEYIDGCELLEEFLPKFIGEFYSSHHENYIG